MIYIQEFNKTIDSPTEELSVEIKNYLFKNLKSGYCIFIIPSTIDSIDKRFKKNYKIGFLFDLLGSIYPNLNKSEKHTIISEKYHTWIVYRQFKTIIDEYEKDRKKYLLKPEMLCI